MENNNNNININQLNQEETAAAVDFSAIEKAAAVANDLNSFSEYKPGTATAEIKNAIKEARENLKYGLSRCATEKQKDDLKAKFASYEKKILSYCYAYYRNEAACPSVLICGAGNFPTAKKNKQNARRDSLRQEWQQLESLKNSLRGGYSMSISSDDPQAVEALTAKLEKLKKAHAFKVAANAYFRKNKTFKGMEGLNDEAAEKLDNDARNAAARMGGRCEPFPAWSLSNENAEIKRVENRLQELQQRKENTLNGWNFDGGRVEIDAENGRIGVYFDERTTGADLEAMHKENKDLYLPRLLWSPRFQRWQCQNNAANIRRLQMSKTYAPNDDESKKAIEEAEKQRQEQQAAKAAEEEKAKAEKANKAAAAFTERTEKLKAKQEELKKIGFTLKGAQLAYCQNRLSDYLENNHGLRRIIKLENGYILTVEIFYTSEYKQYKEHKNIICEIQEGKEENGFIKSGTGFMLWRYVLEELEEGARRDLKSLEKYAKICASDPTYNARIIALYNAYKEGKIEAKTRGWMDQGNELNGEQAREFLKNWKPEDQQEEPTAKEEQEQAPKAPEQKEKEEPTTPAPYLSIKGEQLYLF